MSLKYSIDLLLIKSAIINAFLASFFIALKINIELASTILSSTLKLDKITTALDLFIRAFFRSSFFNGFPCLHFLMDFLAYNIHEENNRYRSILQRKYVHRCVLLKLVNE